MRKKEQGLSDLLHWLKHQDDSLCDTGDGWERRGEDLRGGLSVFTSPRRQKCWQPPWYVTHIHHWHLCSLWHLDKQFTLRFQTHSSFVSPPVRRGEEVGVSQWDQSSVWYRSHALWGRFTAFTVPSPDIQRVVNLSRLSSSSRLLTLIPPSSLHRTGWSRPRTGHWGGRRAEWRRSRRSPEPARCWVCGSPRRSLSAGSACCIPREDRGSAGQWLRCLKEPGC